MGIERRSALGARPLRRLPYDGQLCILTLGARPRDIERLNEQLGFDAAAFSHSQGQSHYRLCLLGASLLLSSFDESQDQGVFVHGRA